MKRVDKSSSSLILIRFSVIVNQKIINPKDPSKSVYGAVLISCLFLTGLGVQRNDHQLGHTNQSVQLGKRISLCGRRFWNLHCLFLRISNLVVFLILIEKCEIFEIFAFQGEIKNIGNNSISCQLVFV